MNPTVGPHGFPRWDKDPQAVKDYSLDWSDWLGTDTIASSTWEVPSGIIKDQSGNTTTVTSVWLRGGTIGNTYQVSNKVTTAGGRTDVRTIEIQVKKQ